MKQEWILMIKQADFAGLSAKFGVPPLLIKLMINRGIGEEEYGNIFAWWNEWTS